MFDELKSAWITELYKSYKGILIPSVSSQLSTQGFILDLDSLPIAPIPFKEFFIRWLVSVNKDRIENNQPIIITTGIVLACPIWKAIKCPLKRITLTKESMFNKPKPPKGLIGSKQSIGSFNRRKK